jgi:hypothetical protein
MNNPWEIADRISNLDLGKLTTIDFSKAMAEERTGLNKSLSQLQVDIKQGKSANLKISPFSANLGVLSDILCSKKSLPKDISSKHNAFILGGKKKLSVNLDLSCADGSNVLKNVSSILDALPLLTDTIKDYLADAEDTLVSMITDFLSGIFGDLITSLLMELFKDYVLGPINCMVDKVLNNISNTLMSRIKSLEDLLDFNNLLKTITATLGGDCIEPNTFMQGNQYFMDSVVSGLLDAVFDSNTFDNTQNGPFYYLYNSVFIPRTSIIKALNNITNRQIKKHGLHKVLVGIKGSGVLVNSHLARKLISNTYTARASTRDKLTITSSNLVSLISPIVKNSDVSLLDLPNRKNIGNVSLSGSPDQNNNGNTVDKKNNLDTFNLLLDLELHKRSSHDKTIDPVVAMRLGSLSINTAKFKSMCPLATS